MEAFTGKVVGGGGTRVGEPHEDVKVPGPVTSKPPSGASGKVWLKAKFVNEMAALLVMVNFKIPLTLIAELPLMKTRLGSYSILKVGAGVVTVRLIAAAVALGAWSLLRITAGLVRTPGAVTRRSRLMVQLALAANEPLTNEMELSPGVVSAPPQPLLRLLGVATTKPVGKGSEKLRPVRGRAAVLVIV
jgi:hypothetical protein